MTRDIDWGIQCRSTGGGPALEAALRLVRRGDRYLSASVEWAPAGQPERWREWWNDPEALTYYFMGKDNITFHSQIWPAELLAYAGKGPAGASRATTGC